MLCKHQMLVAMVFNCLIVIRKLRLLLQLPLRLRFHQTGRVFSERRVGNERAHQADQQQRNDRRADFFGPRPRFFCRAARVRAPSADAPNVGVRTKLPELT